MGVDFEGNLPARRYFRQETRNGEETDYRKNPVTVHGDSRVYHASFRLRKSAFVVSGSREYQNKFRKEVGMREEDLGTRMFRESVTNTPVVKSCRENAPTKSLGL